MKTYKFIKYSWGNDNISVLLCNKNREYTDIEFKKLCANIVIDKGYKYINKHEHTKLKNVSFYYIYNDILEELKNNDFEEITTDSSFGLFDEESILDFEDIENDTDRQILQQQYLNFVRKQKLERINKD